MVTENSVAEGAHPADDKRRYVRGRTQTRPHTCHWPDCNRQVPPAMWGCRTHWMALPKALRDRIWTTYAPGQEERLDPSAAYLLAAKAVQEWIADRPSTHRSRP